MKRTVLSAASLLAVALSAALPAPRPGDPCSSPTPIVTLPTTINDPGTYCVVGDLTATPGMNGIIVAADDVTIDLNGYTLTGDPSTTGIVSIGPTDITAKNGRLTGWGTSVSLSTRRNSIADLVCEGGGIVMGFGSRVERCVVEDAVNSRAIKLGPQSVAQDCSTRRSSAIGFETDSRTRLERCTSSFDTDCGFDLVASVARDCSVLQGKVGFAAFGNSSLVRCQAATLSEVAFETSAGTVLTDCRAEDTEAGPGFLARDSFLERCTSTRNTRGFQLAGDTTAVHCTAFDNAGSGFTTTDEEPTGFRLEACTARGNGASGVYARGASWIKGCTLVENHRAGVAVLGDDAVVEHNHARGNEQYGLWVDGDRNRLDGNHVVGSGTGLFVLGADNLIVRNSLGDHGVPYSIEQGNTRGPFVTMSDWISSENPWANFNLSFPW